MQTIKDACKRGNFFFLYVTICESCLLEPIYQYKLKYDIKNY